MQTSFYDALSWDTRFFGFPVGMIDAIEHSSEQVQSQLVDISVSPPCRLLYIHVDPEDASTRQMVTQLGAQLVDNRMVFRKNIVVSQSADVFRVDTPLEVYAGHECKELNELAFLAGKFSRFRADPEISEVDFQRLYSQWISRSISGIIADKVLISRDENNAPASLITLSHKDVIGSIGLLAVRADQQGKGLGVMLINQALDFLQAEFCTTAEVITQKTNTAACNLYEKTGFIPIRSTDTYHLWLPFTSTRNRR